MNGKIFAESAIEELNQSMQTERKRNWKLWAETKEKLGSFEELSFRTGIPGSTLSRICSGYRAATESQMEAIAKALEMGKVELFRS